MKVVVALIKDTFNRLLITERSLQSPHGGFWEFPGGKLENGETSWQALLREIKEEVDLDIISANYLGSINHSYAEKSLTIMAYLVTEFKGEARCCELQTDLKWVGFDELAGYQFPAANQKIIELYYEHVGCVEKGLV